MCESTEFVTAYELAAEEYRRQGGSLDQDTVKNNSRAFLRMANLAGAKTVEEFNFYRAPCQWQADYFLRNEGLRSRDRLKVAANSYCMAARSLWARILLPIYERMGFAVPKFDPDAWPSMKGVKYFAYKRPPLELRRRTADWYEELDRTNDPLWVAVTLIYRFAVRPEDAAGFTWDVFREDLPGKWILDYVPRKTDGRCNTVREVKWGIRSDLLEKLRARGGERFVIPKPSYDARYKAYVRVICQEMRKLGWKREVYSKASYELRKLCIDTVYAKCGAEKAAQLFLPGMEPVVREEVLKRCTGARISEPQSKAVRALFLPGLVFGQSVMLLGFLRERSTRLLLQMALRRRRRSGGVGTRGHFVKLQRWRQILFWRCCRTRTRERPLGLEGLRKSCVMLDRQSKSASEIVRQVGLVLTCWTLWSCWRMMEKKSKEETMKRQMDFPRGWMATKNFPERPKTTGH